MNSFYHNGDRVPNLGSGPGAEAGQIHTAQRGPAATCTRRRTEREQIWLRLGRAALYRRVLLCQTLGNAGAWDRSDALPNTIRRYGRLKICATIVPPPHAK